METQIKFEEISQERKTEMLNQVEKLQAVMPEYDLYLHFGTLLGAVRDKALILHDDDIDVAYISKYHTPQEVEDETKMLYKRFLDASILGLYFKQARTDKWFEPVEVPDYDIKEPVGQCHVMFGDNHLDLYSTFIDENDNYYNPLEPEPWCKSDKVIPFKRGKIYDMEFNIPNDSEFLLQHHYGDWRIPSKKKADKPIYSSLKLWKERYEKS